ncbi:hypothetical protein DM860_003585 [Cuscuta australis]|uniref:Uncharacterized protein n=1 Tax=Cuscuta australis TaxID=267555 RepID=A0A328DHC1_9ASTE|nr:hypothetical protein DM860_003585 [Cuscuta australis]
MRSSWNRYYKIPLLLLIYHSSTKSTKEFPDQPSDSAAGNRPLRGFPKTSTRGRMPYHSDYDANINASEEQKIGMNHEKVDEKEN